MPIPLMYSVILISIAGLILLSVRIVIKHSIMFNILFCVLLNACIMLCIGFVIGSNSMKDGTIVFAISLALGGIGLTFFLLHRVIARPLKLVVNMLKLISEGSRDLTKNINYDKRNEIGDIARYFNSFLSSLNCIITSVKRLTGENLGVSARLKKTSESFSESLKPVSLNAEVIRDRTVGLDNAINEANSTILSFREFLGELADKISGQATAINESSASIEQMTKSIGNVSITLRTKLASAEELATLAENGSTVMNTTVENIRKITGATQIINEALETIKSIGSQTNLLAMNAAIEAAHAGESGKGFSVVAEEIRKLAEESAIRSKAITTSLKEITSRISVTEESSGKSGDFFNQIVHRIGDVRDGIMEVEDSMSELSEGSQQILTSLGALVESTTNIKDSSMVMTGKVEEIVRTDSMIAEISGKIKNEILEISTKINELSASIEKILRSCSINAQNVGRIESLTSGFKV